MSIYVYICLYTSICLYLYTVDARYVDYAVSRTFAVEQNLRSVVISEAKTTIDISNYFFIPWEFEISSVNCMSISGAY